MKLASKSYLLDGDIFLNPQVKQIFLCQHSTITDMLKYVSIPVSTQMHGVGPVNKYSILNICVDNLGCGHYHSI